MKAGLPPRLNRTTRFLLLALLAAQCTFAQQPRPAEPASVAPVATRPDGAALFAEHCAKCHGDRGQGIATPTVIAGPSLQAVHEHGDVISAMEIGPSHMPRFAYYLSIAQMDAIADFVTSQVASIPKVRGDVGSGGELFRAYCAACHRAALHGGALVFTGVNAPDISHKSEAMIAGAIRWGPGPMPAFPPTVLTDKEVWSIVEYIRVMQHAPAPGGHPLHWNGPVSEGFVAWVILFFVIMVTAWIEKGGRG